MATTHYITASPTGPGAATRPHIVYKTGFFFAAKRCDAGEAFTAEELATAMENAEAIIEDYNERPDCVYRVEAVTIEKGGN